MEIKADLRSDPDLPGLGWQIQIVLGEKSFDTYELVFSRVKWISKENAVIADQFRFAIDSVQLTDLQHGVAAMMLRR